MIYDKSLHVDKLKANKLHRIHFEFFFIKFKMIMKKEKTLNYSVLHLTKKYFPVIIFFIVTSTIILQLIKILNVSFIDSLLVGLLLGMTINNITFIPKFESLDKGGKFAGKHILEFSVMLMGASIFFPDLIDNGIKILLIIILGISGSMLISYLVGHKIFKLEKKLATLVGVGNSICGNSAVAIVAPIINANSSQIAAAIGISAILGASQIILLPLLVPIFGIEEFEYGLVAGLSVYAVAQVVAAASTIGPQAVNVATLVKLTRVILLAPLILILKLFFKSENINKSNDSLHKKIFKFLPWFVIGFLGLCLLRSINIIDQSLGQDIRSIAKYLFIISMIAIGLSVDIKKIIDVGPRVAITIISIISFMICLGLITSKFI